MQTCAACGGAIGEQGKAYGYAGRWCHCPKPIPDDYPKVSGTGVGTIKDFIDTHLPPGPIIVVPPEEVLTPAAFVFWLRGYFAAGGAQGDAKTIAAQLAKVKP